MYVVSMKNGAEHVVDADDYGIDEDGELVLTDEDGGEVSRFHWEDCSGVAPIVEYEESVD